MGRDRTGMRKPSGPYRSGPATSAAQVSTFRNWRGFRTGLTPSPVLLTTARQIRRATDPRRSTVRRDRTDDRVHWPASTGPAPLPYRSWVPPASEPVQKFRRRGIFRLLPPVSGIVLPPADYPKRHGVVHSVATDATAVHLLAAECLTTRVTPHKTCWPRENEGVTPSSSNVGFPRRLRLRTWLAGPAIGHP